MSLNIGGMGVIFCVIEEVEDEFYSQAFVAGVEADVGGLGLWAELGDGFV